MLNISALSRYYIHYYKSGTYRIYDEWINRYLPEEYSIRGALDKYNSLITKG